MSEPTTNKDDRPPSIAAAISALLKTMPGASASLAERIAWFEHKAAVFDRIATDTNPFIGDTQKATAVEMAKAARLTAKTIREQGDQR